MSRSLITILLALTVGLTVAGCKKQSVRDDGGDGGDEGGCTPNDFQECPCAGGEDGFQYCQEDGTWGAWGGYQHSFKHGS